ncbi:MAG TPA: DNA replication and repair protein RecF [Polyangiaceae bacterium]
MTGSPLQIERVTVRSIRNLELADFAPGPRFNVISCDNGQGKTSLLESIYLAATSRSFRTSRLQEMIAHGQDIASVRLVVGESEGRHEQSLGIAAAGGQRQARIDGKRPPSLAAFAVKTPIVVFHPGEVALSSGPSGERRKLLDRVVLHTAFARAEELLSYTRAMRARQEVLDKRGDRAADLEEWETLMARHGLAVVEARRDASLRLAEVAEAAFARIAAPGLVLRVRYLTNVPEDHGAFVDLLRGSRTRDRIRKAAAIGPQRDDLVLEIDGKTARQVASQGQHRAIVLSLKAAEIDVIAHARGIRPVLLLDDVSSELDRARTIALVTFLGDQRGQVFLTTTRPELIESEGLGGGSGRRDFVVERGVLNTASG